MFFLGKPINQLHLDVVLEYSLLKRLRNNS